jgi:hypothetical protein
VTVYVPELLTEIACVVSPVFHKYELPLVAVNITEPPAQKVVAPPAEIVGIVQFVIVKEDELTVCEIPFSIAVAVNIFPDPGPSTFKPLLEKFATPETAFIDDVPRKLPDPLVNASVTVAVASDPVVITLS